jgi:hypothetical protein
LRFAHGSQAPETSALSSAELCAVRAQTPGQALDKAAALYGVSTSYAELAGKHDYYDPSAPDWQGHCHAWSWASLNKVVDAKVDVDGPEGQRGVWIGGQWLSRADLGDWMMALGSNISFDNEETTVSLRHGTDMDKMMGNNPRAPTPDDLVKGMMQYLSATGGGLIADVSNDQSTGTDEIWNQPFYRGEFDVKGLSGKGADALLEHAEADGVKFPAGVKLLRIKGDYGREVSDDHEGAPASDSKTWNVYAVTDANGKMLKAYMADDPAFTAIDGLPTHQSDAMPDSLWNGHRSIKAALEGKSSWAIDRDKGLEDKSVGTMFRFFVHDVLQKGVPGTVRAAFESELAALPAGPLDAAKLSDLAKRYPGVANAYSPEQWAKAFGSRGLTPDAFGAGWQH